MFFELPVSPAKLLEQPDEAFSPCQECEWEFECELWLSLPPLSPGSSPAKAAPAVEARPAPMIAVSRDQPDGPQPPYPDEREWKRLVSRYRS